MIISLDEERADLCASVHVLFILNALVCLSFVSSSWCKGLAAACDCGTPWTFPIFFFYQTGQ